MNWLNIETAMRGWPEFIGSDPAARGTWTAVALYCASLENGGIVPACSSWGDRQWQQTCGVTRAEVDASSKLLRWSGDDLHVFAYPIEQESAFKASIEGGRKGGLQKARNRAEKLGGVVAPLVAGVVAPLLRKEKEGKEKEGNGMEMQKAVQAAPTAALAADQLTLSPPAASPMEKPAKRRKSAPGTDAEWLASLAASPAYAGMDVAREHAKASEWCRVRQQVLSRQRFINWLNRADKPLTATNAQRTATTQFRHNAIASSDYRGISD